MHYLSSSSRYFFAIWLMVFGLSGVYAQDKVTRLIVPFAAGAAQDLMARSISTELGQALGQTVVVENKAGAGGVIGTTLVARAVPDGQTLDMAAAGHLIAKYVYKNLPYDPLTALVPAAYTGEVGYVLIVPGNSPINTVADLIKMVKADPGKPDSAIVGTSGKNLDRSAAVTAINLTRLSSLKPRATMLAEIVASERPVMTSITASPVDLVGMCSIFNPASPAK